VAFSLSIKWAKKRLKFVDKGGQLSRNLLGLKRNQLTLTRTLAGRFIVEPMPKPEPAQYMVRKNYLRKKKALKKALERKECIRDRGAQEKGGPPDMENRKW